MKTAIQRATLRFCTVFSVLSVFQMRFLSSGQAVAAEKPAKSWQKICEQVASLPFPAADRPSARELKTLESCSPYNLYYGFYETADPQKARLCAYTEIDKPTEEGPFDGMAMLMTIYANGVGARRNFDLAIKLACKIGGAPAEEEGRVLHLAQLREQHWQGNDFSLCDDITSGYMAGFCADHASRFAERGRLKQLGRIQAKWSTADKKEYALLRKTADHYFNLHAENEVDQSGTARAAMFIDDISAQEDDFISMLGKLEKGKFSRYSNQQLQEADARLNAVYKEIQKKYDSNGGTVTKEGIKAAQRGWLKYRDAWVRFIGRKYPDCSSDSLQTHMTMKRIKELEEFLN